MSYSQEIYDAVRSRISGGDVGQAMSDALREAFGMAHHHMAGVAQEFTNAAWEQTRPSVLYKPCLSLDGDQWCALYGDNLQDGLAGFGDSPEAAMADFDANWIKPTLRRSISQKAFDEMMGINGWPESITQTEQTK